MMLPLILFTAFIVCLLALDLGVFHKESQAVSFRGAIGMAAVWVALALLFNGFVFFWRGPDAALTFLAAYLMEESLSLDNLFVFLLIFKYFNVPANYQHRVLFWGILGAIGMRALFIATGVALIPRFHFVIYLFGGFLIFSGIRMMFQKEKPFEPEANPFLRFCKRFLPLSQDYGAGHFFVKPAGRWLATPLFLTLLCVETSDLIFAVDSIPAVFAITLDPFLVYTSNIFAILGLRAIFFALASMMDRFCYLSYGLSAILVFVGLKMLLAEVYSIPIVVTLIVLVFLLAVSVIASLCVPLTVATSSCRDNDPS